jgi:transposase
MASCYELKEKQWDWIADLLPGRTETVGRTAVDNRLFVNSVLWVLRSGARWSDLPERYGKYKSVHKRLARRAISGVWDHVFRTLTQDVQNEHLMIDSTIVRAHQQAATGRKKGARIRLWGVPVEA